MRNDSTKSSESSSVITAENAITLQIVEFFTSANEALRGEHKEMCENCLR